MSVFDGIGVRGVEPLSLISLPLESLGKQSWTPEASGKGPLFGQASPEDLSEELSLGNSISLVHLIPLAGENLFSALQEGETEAWEVKLPEVTGLVSGNAAIFLTL